MGRLSCSALLVALVVVGCGRLGYAAVDPVARDGGPMDAGDGAIGDGSVDANIDAARLDASVDAGELVDAGDAASSPDAGPIDAGPIDAGSDAGPGPCGLLGNACCPGAPTCSDGACLGGVCASSGGAYVERVVISTVTCDQPNPLTGACTCPVGFARGGIFEVYRNEATPVILEAYFCVPPATPSGGLVAACERCACPPGSNLGDHSCPFTGFYMDSFGTCTGAHVPGDRFRGAYSMLGATCDRPNAATGGCSCPAGTARTTFDLGCRTAVMCWRP